MREQLLGMTTPVLAAAFAAVFFALWWRAGLGKHVLAFGVSFACAAIAFLATHLLPTGSIYTFHLTHAFYALSTATMVWGMCSRVGRPAYLGVQVSIYGTAALLLSVAVMTSQDAGPRLLIVNTAYGAMFLVGMVSLMGAPRRHVLDTLILVIAATNVADFMIRPMLQLLAEGAIPVAEYRQSIYYSVINLVLSIKALSLAIVLVVACAHELMTAMRERSDRDALTGLRNRRAFETDIAGPLMLAQQTGVPVSLVIADIDHFKQVNDIWGHQAGDQAIAEFGQLIGSMTREQDIAGRVGGEEFCVLVWDCPGEAAEKLAERIRSRFAQHLVPAIGESVRLAASFGVAHLREGESYERLFARADAALYRAKQNGRNRVEGDRRNEGEPAVRPAIGTRVAA